MKRKITIQLPTQTVERLAAAAERRGLSRTKVVEAALERFLAAEVETSDDATLLQRLNTMAGRLEQLDRDIKTANEIAALHACYHLTVAPVLPPSQQRAACVLGLDRFDEFATQVVRRVERGTSLLEQTMDRLRGTDRIFDAREPEEGRPFGVPPVENDREIPLPTAIDVEPELPAAAPEGGSNGGFPREDYNSWR